MTKPGTKQPPGQDSARKNLFCYFLARLGNPEEAAVRAGYPAHSAARDAARLMGQKATLQALARCEQAEQERQTASQALAGLRRLAFGPSNDAVRLLLSDLSESPVEIGELDLFHVSEIKRPKGGGFEIKFYDRLAALQLLLEKGPEAAGPHREGLSEALERSARMLAQRSGNDAP